MTLLPVYQTKLFFPRTTKGTLKYKFGDYSAVKKKKNELQCIQKYGNEGLTFV